MTVTMVLRLLVNKPSFDLSPMLLGQCSVESRSAIFIGCFKSLPIRALFADKLNIAQSENLSLHECSMNWALSNKVSYR